MPLGGVGEVLELSWPKNSLRKKKINSLDTVEYIRLGGYSTVSVYTAEKIQKQPHAYRDGLATH